MRAFIVAIVAVAVYLAAFSLLTEAVEKEQHFRQQQLDSLVSPEQRRDIIERGGEDAF